jgi:AraC-like DNA-binding protein
VGFQTQAHFTTVFKRIVGCTPHRWRVFNQMPTCLGARSGKPIGRTDPAAGAAKIRTGT